jgi:4-hydroxybenzoate polyprenyltransferase
LQTASLKIPIATALVLVIPLSLLSAGWFGGGSHIAAVASAQIYNIYLSRSVWSWLPYATSFALLPFFVAQAASHTLWPIPAMPVMFALVGVIAHLLNALPDIEIDRQANRGGLAVSLGRRNSLVLASALCVAALGVLIYLLLSSTPPAAT